VAAAALKAIGSKPIRYPNQASKQTNKQTNKAERQTNKQNIEPTANS